VVDRVSYGSSALSGGPHERCAPPDAGNDDRRGAGPSRTSRPGHSAFEAREGHLVLNHTWTHPRLTDLTAARIRAETLRTQRVLAAAGAPLPVKLLRPPYGAVILMHDGPIDSAAGPAVQADSCRPSRM
jgi:peptidoglycan/xylan/chitin deacetylase (PgdA/CDA1 family)